jgi:membrane protease YdiL (CAAX protease family)
MAAQTKLYTPSSRTHESVSWAMLAGLLILRLLLMTGVGPCASISWLDPLSELCTYVLTLCLIWWERDRLALFHIDALSIVLIIFLKPIQTLYLGFLWITVQYDNILAFPRFPSLVIWIGAAALFFVIRKKYPDLLKVQKTSWRWFGVGILVGVGQALLLGYPMSFDPTFRNSKPILLNELLPILPFFVYGLGYAAVTEDPMFRGFLWGHLRKAGWNEGGYGCFRLCSLRWATSTTYLECPFPFGS